MIVREPRTWTFGDFRIDTVGRTVSRLDGTPVVLTARVFDTLLYLVRHAGVSLGKEELLGGIWPGRVVEENNLTQSISTLRKALGANADGHRYIVTEPGRGYRFVADVHPELDSDPEHREPSAKAPPNIRDEPAPHQAPLIPTRASRARSKIALTLTLLAVLIATGVWWSRQPTQAPHAPQTTIAVLPFKPLLAGDRDEVLELGMADTLIEKLGSNRRLVVRSLGSVRKFGAMDQDPLAAARELGVGSVLDGVVQRRADHVHVSARLLSAPAGKTLWAASYDENFSDVFALQDSIAQKVATALALQFEGDDQRFMRTGYTQNSEAYLLYLKGRYRVGKVTPSEIRAGMESFHKAIDLDPTFALAYAALAEAYRRLPITSDSDPRETFPLAKAAAQKALEIDADLAEAHSVLGWVAFWYEWNWPLAEREFRRAIELNPNVAEAHLGYAHLLFNTGRNAEAVEQGRIARELDPLSPLVNTITAGFLAEDHRRDEAQAILKRALEIDPDFWVAHLVRGGAALGAGNYPAAIAEMTRAKENSGGSMQAVSMLGYALAKSGDRAGAQRILDDTLSHVDDRYVPATSVATLYIGLGDNEHALTWLERAYDQRDVRLAFLKVDRRWDPLRTEPRFVALSEKVGLRWTTSPFMNF